jgi:hypothetical protein
MRLEEIDASIQIKEANLAQLPSVMNEKKAEMTAKYNELKAIRDQKNKVILRSAIEDNQLISEANAIRLDALNAVRAVLDL